MSKNEKTVDVSKTEAPGLNTDNAAKNSYETAVELHKEAPAIDTTESRKKFIADFNKFASEEIEHYSAQKAEAVKTAGGNQYAKPVVNISARLRKLEQIAEDLNSGDLEFKNEKNEVRATLSEILSERIGKIGVATTKSKFAELPAELKSQVTDEDHFNALQADSKSQPVEITKQKIIALTTMKAYAELLSKNDAIILANKTVTEDKDLHGAYVKNDLAISIFESSIVGKDLAKMKAVILTFAKAHKKATSAGDGEGKVIPTNYKYVIEGKVYSGKHSTILVEILKDKKVPAFTDGTLSWDGKDVLKSTGKDTPAKHKSIAKKIGLPACEATMPDGSINSEYCKARAKDVK